MIASTDVIEHLRSRERAAYVAWRDAAWSDPNMHALAETWKKALRALTEEETRRFA